MKNEGQSEAAFDAWSTRRAISGGYGTEANPLLRPFAHSNALYVATQVSPALMDFLGKRMMTSRHAMFRKLWWLPQTAGAGLSFAAGSHNVALTNSGVPPVARQLAKYSTCSAAASCFLESRKFLRTAASFSAGRPVLAKDSRPLWIPSGISASERRRCKTTTT